MYLLPGMNFVELRACEVRRITLPRTLVNTGPSGPACDLLYGSARIREPLLRVHKRPCKLLLARRSSMMDRHSASSRMNHEAEGAQAEWLGAMQSLAEQIEKQQQTSQQMTQELMNTYMQLLNTP